MRRRAFAKSKRRRRYRTSSTKRTKTKNKHSRKRVGGNTFGFPESSNSIVGGAGFDTRFTFSQPLTNIIDGGTHQTSSWFNSLMGRSHDVNPAVTNQPHLI